MKKFSNSLNESNSNPYSQKDNLKYEIYDIIENTFSGDIDGKQDLVNSLSVLIKREEIKNQISTLESIKNNPGILQKKSNIEIEIFDTNVNEYGELVVESKKINK
jgi:hypothetical protein